MSEETHYYFRIKSYEGKMAVSTTQGAKRLASTETDLSEYVPPELRALEDPRRDLPRIAKDRKLSRSIDAALAEVPTTHELYCTDSREMRFLRPESVHLILTSPPY